MFENTSLPDLIELKKVSQSYDGGNTWVIKDLDMLIEDKPKQGQFVVLLGPSGCGKSTLLRYISGLQTPTVGEVLLYGKPRDPAHHIGMVFQKYSSFPWLTVAENVELGLKLTGVKAEERRQRALEMLKLVELEDQANKYAMYPTLSGGQLQRVAIARSLLANAEVLLMDEPFGALDVRTRLLMQELLLRIWSELSKKSEATTIMLVTHDITEAVYLADEIFVMSRAPAQIVRRIPVPWGLERTRELKQSDGFKKMVSEIEETIMTL
jgi:NitT/TauT family transport system ATP-binding protein